MASAAGDGSYLSPTLNASQGVFTFVVGFHRNPGIWGFFASGVAGGRQSTYVADVLPYYSLCRTTDFMQIAGSEVAVTPAIQKMMDARPAELWADDCQPSLYSRCAADYWATTQPNLANPSAPYLVKCTRCPANSRAAAGLSAACSCGAGYATLAQLLVPVQHARFAAA